MVGVFDIGKGAFDSSEAALLRQAFDIAMQGMATNQPTDSSMANKLARSIMKVARSEPDCLRNDGTIDPAKLAQRAILRMLQTSAPIRGASTPVDAPATAALSLRQRLKARLIPIPGEALPSARPRPESAAKIMLRLFERTPFAKL